MVTRTQSAKGSFVQSPKGAFNAGRGWYCSAQADIPGSNIRINAACGFTSGPTAPPFPGWLLTAIKNDAPVPIVTPGELFTATYTGETSGFIWTPSLDAWSGVSCIDAQGTERRVMGAVYDDSPAVPANVNEYILSMQASQNLISIRQDSNYTIPGNDGGARQPTGFILEEDVTVVYA